MAWLESNRGRLLIGFRYRGERCREYLGLDDNRDNRRTAARTLKEDRGRTGERKVRLRRTISGEPETCALRPDASARRFDPRTTKASGANAWRVRPSMAGGAAHEDHDGDRL